MSGLTHKEVRKLLAYNPVTGVLTWRVHKGGRSKGQIAGCRDLNGYVVIGINTVGYKAHRLAFLLMTGRWPKDQIDHINHCKSNNKWDNLRECTNIDNGRNLRVYKNNTSGCTGVYWCKINSKWKVMIKAHGVLIYLGRFLLKEEAIKVRKLAEIKYGFHKNHGKGL